MKAHKAGNLHIIEGKLTEDKVKVTKKDIKDIEDSGNIDIAYKKAMALLKSLSESLGESKLNESEVGRLMILIDDGATDAEILKEFPKLNAGDLAKWYNTFIDKDLAAGMKSKDLGESNTQVPAKTIAITEGTDLGVWNQGGPKGNQNVLITQYLGPKDIEDLGMGRQCIQINVGRDYVQLNPADIIELQDILKSYKVK